MVLNITDLLNQWADAGVFSYVLPFLLVFAFVFAILEKTKIIGENRGAQIILAIAVGGLSLVGDYVPNFFQTIFPYTGMAIAYLLCAIILISLFLGDSDKAIDKTIKWILVSVGIIAAIFVGYNSFSDATFSGSYWWYNWGSTIIVLALVIGAIVAITVKKK